MVQPLAHGTVCCSTRSKMPHGTELACSSAIFPASSHNHICVYCRPQFAEPEEQFILIMDSDMIMRRRYVPDELKVRPGAAL